MKRRCLGLVAAMLLVVGCSAPVAYYRCDTPSDADAPDVRRIWTCNRDVMTRVVKGEKFSLREFRGAAEFFEELTGIPADTRSTSLGLQPGLGIERNLEQWDAWYREHRDGLVWDAGAGKVRLNGN